MAYGYGFPAATTLAVLMTEAERQPVEVDEQIFHAPVGPRHCVQGAPTSPGLCNALVLRLDRRLAGLAKKHGLTYTRYADDLSFSGDLDRAMANRIRLVATRIVQAEGFQINTDKTQFMSRGTRQIVTGVVVNKVLGLPRKERRRLRAMAHRLRVQADTGTRVTQRAKLEGKLAYLSMLNASKLSRSGRSFLELFLALLAVAVAEHVAYAEMTVDANQSSQSKRRT
jgi:hypothetical protein